MKTTMKVRVVKGDLLEQSVDAIVNAYNRNIIPWWLLIPQGVSGAIKRRAGIEPFRQLAKHGPIPLGEAVLTGPGRLPFKGIIHVAGISMWWTASEASIRGSVKSAIRVAREAGYESVAFPLIGAGTGGGRPDEVLAMMQDELQQQTFGGEVVLVQFGKAQ